jgi:hypothetical protein
MQYQLKGFRSQVTAVALVCGIAVAAQLFGIHQRSGEAQAAGAGSPTVIANTYVPRNQGDDAMPAAPLVDGAVFIVAALPGPCSSEPPCFDRAAVMAELIRIGGGESECYQVTNLEQAGNYVTGRIDSRSDAPAATGCG